MTCNLWKLKFIFQGSFVRLVGLFLNIYFQEGVWVTCGSVGGSLRHEAAGLMPLTPISLSLPRPPLALLVFGLGPNLAVLGAFSWLCAQPSLLAGLKEPSVVLGPALTRSALLPASLHFLYVSVSLFTWLFSCSFNVTCCSLKCFISSRKSYSVCGGHLESFFIVTFNVFIF